MLSQWPARQTCVDSGKRVDGGHGKNANDRGEFGTQRSDPFGKVD